MELIDKAAVIEKIDNLVGNLRYTVDDEAIQIDILSEVENFINTIKVKEVDLEKELIEWHKEHFKKDGTFIGMSGFYLGNSSQMDIAKHFFELGLKVNNDAVIDKAYEWLKTNVTYTHPRTGETKCVVNLNAFRDAMKGE